MTTAHEGALEGFFEALLEDDAAELYDHAPCGYLSTTPDGLIVKVNQTFLTLTGYRREELVGLRRFAELLPPGGRIYHETHYAPLLQMHSAAHEIALDVVRADGSRLPVLVNSVLKRDATGRPTVVRTAVFDAIQRREYERELLRAKERAERSETQARALARTLQETLIPPTVPLVPGLDVAGAYRPAGDGSLVGGDFYDVFQVGPDDWVVLVGDVCGKGVEAAVVTALARYTLRAAVVQHASPAEAIGVLNEVLLRHETDRFCTVALLRLHRDGPRWTAIITCAGHPQPMLRSRRGAVRPVGDPGSLVGVLREPVNTDLEVALEPGDALVLYTDGVTEARRDGQFFGEHHLAQVLQADHADAAALADRLLQEAMAFQDGQPNDDIAIVTVRVPE